MKKYRLIYFIIIGLIFLNFGSCKKTAQELSEKVLKESAEKGTKTVSKEASEKTLKKITQQELKNIDWGDLIKIIRKDNINLAESLSKLDKSFQKKIGKAINSDYEFYITLISSNTIVDEFTVFTKGSSKAAKNIDLFKFFTKSRELERRFGFNNAVGNMIVKEETGIIKLINKTDNSILGELRDGILTLRQPFKEGTDILDQNSLLKKTLIPNTVYKIKGNNGLSYLYHIDNLGRFSKIEATGVNSQELISNILEMNKNLDLGPEWIKDLRLINKNKGLESLNVNVFYKYIDEEKLPLSANINIKKEGKEIINKSYANHALKNISKKIVKEYTGEEVFEIVSKKGYKNLSDLIRKFEGYYGSSMSPKNLVLQELEDGTLRIQYKGSSPASFSALEIKGNTIYAKAGSLPGENSAQNQFLNNVLPNMNYVIDDVFFYKTDKLGRVIEAYVDRSELLIKNIRREGRASEIQREIRKNYPGHDGGHIFDMGSGGPNEILNQVPMESKFNRNGEWKKLENLEKKAVAEGKDVKIKRIIKYSDDSTRPVEFLTELTIDGETQIITLVNPLP